jgi:hypothetical protein
MKHLFSALVAIALIIVFAGTASAQRVFRVNISALNGSGEHGTATFHLAEGSQRLLEVRMSGAPAGAMRHVIVYGGSCAHLSQIEVELPAMTNGETEMQVHAAKVREYEIYGPYVIVVRAEGGRRVACGTLHK